MSAIERGGAVTPGGPGLRQRDEISEMPYAIMARNAVAHLPLDPKSMERAILGVEGTVARFLPDSPRAWPTITKALFMEAIYAASLEPEQRAVVGFLGRRRVEKRAREWTKILELVRPERIDFSADGIVPEFAEYYEGLRQALSPAEPH